MPDLYTKYEYNSDGDLIDPPRIPDYERQLIEAGAMGDELLIETLTEEYEGKRRDMADRHNKRVASRQDEDRRLIAERNERTRAEADAQAQADAATRDRAAADAERNRPQDPPPPEVSPDPSPMPPGDPAPSATVVGDNPNATVTTGSENP